MCDHDQEGDRRDLLKFPRLADFLKEPPFEPCPSELAFLTPAQYEEAFRQVYDKYYRKLVRYLARRTGNPSTAPDLAQEVLFNVYQARSSFERSYIYRAARNTAFSELRRRVRDERLLRALVGRTERAKRDDEA